ncbi:MAG: DUF456 family protein [Haloarculaceae archaeon]
MIPTVAPADVALVAVLAGLDAVTLLALAACLAGVAGAVLPGLPGGPLSLVGVLGYWWHTGFAEPGPLVLAALVGLALLAIAADLGAGFVAARAGGASTRTSLLAGGVGLLLLPFAGPVGVLAGIAGTVFLLELRRRGDLKASARAAAVTTVGVLASAGVQALLTGAVLVGMLLVVL